MKISSFAAVLALGVGLLGTTAQAQTVQRGQQTGARLEYGTYDLNQSGQSGLLQQADWDDHRRCDGDHDLDDRGCRDYYRNRVRYNGYSYYSNGYYYYGPNAGWYDKHGRWHWYKSDRDRKRYHDRDDDWR
jgi:hypothetical protein